MKLLNLNTQARLLSEAFMKDVKGFEKDSKGKFPGKDSYKYAILESAYRALQSGVSLPQLLTDFKKTVDTSFYDVEDFIKETTGKTINKHLKQKKGELLQVGFFYYHPLLQETSRPPVYFLNEETMEMKRQPLEEFYLEIKDSYTIEELLTHYYREHNMERMPGGGHTTQFYNIVKAYGIDLVLYMIDASVEDIKDNRANGAKSPAFLPEYYDRAKEMLGKRKQLAREGGFNYVTPRRVEN